MKSTVQMPKVDAPCGWCSIRLNAVPDPPQRIGKLWYHPGCFRAGWRQQMPRHPRDHKPED